MIRVKRDFVIIDYLIVLFSSFLKSFSLTHLFNSHLCSPLAGFLNGIFRCNEIICFPKNLLIPENVIDMSKYNLPCGTDIITYLALSFIISRTFRASLYSICSSISKNARHLYLLLLLSLIQFFLFLVAGINAIFLFLSYQ